MLALLLDATLKGALILLLAATIPRLMGRRSAAARHLVWSLALLSAAVLPVAGRLLPAWTLELPATVEAAPALVESAPSPAQQTAPIAEPGRLAPAQTQVSVVTPPLRFAQGDTFRPSAFVLVWGLVAALLLSRLLVGLFRLSRLARRAVPASGIDCNAALAAAVRAMGITRPIRLLRSEEIAVPVTWGLRRPTVMLPADCDEWGSERLRAVLIHELAHVARWDFATQLGAELCCAAYWFNPLAWVARRALMAERERACDDRVLAAGTRASAYAAELLELAQQALLPEPPRVALAMARRSELEGRLLAILNPAIRRGVPGARAAISLAAVALAITLPLSALQVDRTPKPPPPAPRPPASQPAPRPPEPRGRSAPPAPAAPSPAAIGRPAPPPPAVLAVPSALTCDQRKSRGSHTNWSSSDDGRKSWKVSWSADGCSVDLKAEGEVKFNADLTDISTISPGGYFELTVRENGGTKRLELRPQGSGLRRTWLVNGNPAPWDDAAQAWFAEFLLAMDRMTGFAVETRFPAILRQGTGAVFNEIDQLGSDYVRGIWYRKLFTAASLTPAEVRRAAKGAGASMESDYELGRVLAALAAKYSLADAEVRSSFIDAAGTLESDYERAQLLMVVITAGPVAPEAGHTIVQLAGGMSSDYEKARVLMALGGSAQMDPKTAAPEYLDVVVGMESDYERGRVLKLILNSGQLSKESLIRVLGVVGRMSSDYEAANVLIAVATRNTLDEAVRAAYLKAADKLSSDYESQRARAALKARI